MIKTAILAIAIILSLSFSVNGQNNEFVLPDYGEKDYDFMRKTLLNDSLFMSILNEKIASGDTSAIQMKLILDSSFETISKNPHFSKEDIKVMIYAFNISRDVLIKFNQIQQEADKLTGLDTLIERAKKELLFLDSLQENIFIDSLKRN